MNIVRRYDNTVARQRDRSEAETRNGRRRGQPHHADRLERPTADRRAQLREPHARRGARAGEPLGITLDTTQTIPGHAAQHDRFAERAAGQQGRSQRHRATRGRNSGMPNGPVESPPGNGPVAQLPSVIGDDYATARQALTQSGFQIAVRFAQQSTNNGTIVAAVAVRRPAGRRGYGHDNALRVGRGARHGRTLAVRRDEAAATVRLLGVALRVHHHASAPAGKSSEPAARGDEPRARNFGHAHRQRDAAAIAMAHRAARPRHRPRAAHDGIRRDRAPQRPRVRSIEAGVVVPRAGATLEQRLSELHAGIADGHRADGTRLSSSSKSSTRPIRTRAPRC